MAGVVDKIFAESDKCEECQEASTRLDSLVGKYASLKSHLEEIFNTKGVKLVFGQGAHFESKDNTLEVPHTKVKEDADDLVDALIFESYNAKRKDQFDTSRLASDVNYDLVASGNLTAQIEVGTMTDFYELAKTMDGTDRTANMGRCIDKVKDASGGVSQFLLASTHVSGEKLEEARRDGDARQLPTKDLYIYENYLSAGPMKIRCVVTKKCNLAVVLNEKPMPGTQGKRTQTEFVPPGTDTPLNTAVNSLDKLLKDNWPRETQRIKRPGVLLKIVDEVSQNDAYSLLRQYLTATALGFTAEMIVLARKNFPENQLKTV